MKIKKILFRTDGNADIGAGHVMRCISIACAAREYNVECKFIISDSSYEKVIKNYDFECVLLQTDYSNMEDEIEKIKIVLKREKASLLVIDSYFVTEKYLIEVKQYLKTMYIDDLKLFAYHTDFLLNYASFAANKEYQELYRNTVDKMPKLILGERYAPLRKEFQNLEEISPKEKVKNILFSAGGADPERIALQFIENVVKKKELIQYTFHIILGTFEPDIEAIEEIEKSCSNLKLHKNVSKMAELMQQCDIAVSAAGSTLFELCACGIPTITYVLADNQLAGAQTLSGKEIMINNGDYRTDDGFFDKMINNIINLSENYSRRCYMHRKAIELIDGKGAKNIVLYLMNSND